jgi:hypothetical protein
MVKQPELNNLHSKKETIAPKIEFKKETQVYNLTTTTQKTITKELFLAVEYQTPCITDQKKLNS